MRLNEDWTEESSSEPGTYHKFKSWYDATEFINPKYMKSTKS